MAGYDCWGIELQEKILQELKGLGQKYLFHDKTRTSELMLGVFVPWISVSVPWKSILLPWIKVYIQGRAVINPFFLCFAHPLL